MTELPPKKLLDIPVEILARRQDTGEWVLYAVVDSFHYTVTEPVIARAYADGYDGIRIRTPGERAVLADDTRHALSAEAIELTKEASALRERGQIYEADLLVIRVAEIVEQLRRPL